MAVTIPTTASQVVTSYVFSASNLVLPLTMVSICHDNVVVPLPLRALTLALLVFVCLCLCLCFVVVVVVVATAVADAVHTTLASLC